MDVTAWNKINTCFLQLGSIAGLYVCNERAGTK